MIYADNAATTQLDIDAFEAMKPFLLDQYGNASQPYSFSRCAKKALNDARKTIAACIGADEKEIIFTSCGTESDNWAISAGALVGKQIITSVIEHHAILNSCDAERSNGKEIIYIPVSHQGIVDLSLLERKISDDTGMVSIMYASNEIGSIQPISEIAKIAHARKCLFHTDAVQAVGHIAIDVHAMDIDMLSASAHKFNGPKGVGFLYLKKGISIYPLIKGGGQENGLRAGTENIASIVAMSVAIEKNCKNIEANTEKLQGLEDALLKTLMAGGLDFLHNGSDSRIPGNVSLSFKRAEGEMILHRLDLQGICISTGSACDSKNTQISHVIKAINIPEEYAKGTIRISFGKNNTVEEAEKIGKSLIKILK